MVRVRVRVRVTMDRLGKSDRDIVEQSYIHRETAKHG
jgi:hypothetical protein